MRTWLLVLLLIPGIAACSLMNAPYSGLDIGGDAFVTTGTADGLLVDLETGKATDLDLGFFAKAVIKPDGTRIATFHQEGLGADCTGRTYVRLLDGDGAQLKQWEVDGPLYAWDTGFYAGQTRDWNGNPSSGPTWDFEWGDVVSADGTTWARYGYPEGNPVFPEEPSGEKRLMLQGKTLVEFELDMNYPRIAVSDDGQVVAAVDGDWGAGKTIHIAVRSMNGPNWDWTFQTNGDYLDPAITINGNFVGVAAQQAYRLNLETGAAQKMDTGLRALSVAHHDKLGWILAEEEGEKPVFVGSVTRARSEIFTDSWLTEARPAWISATSGDIVESGGSESAPAKDTPWPTPAFAALALLWLARKV